jgi:transposase InsO family protein
VTSKYEFIDGEKANYPIRHMCAWISVSASGFYEWRNRPLSATATRRELLIEALTKIFVESDETYGYRRVHAQLVRDGIPAGLELVRALMRQAGLVPCQPKPWRVSLTEQSGYHRIPDLVDRDFTADAPGTKMVGDITYIPTWEGWLYLATVIDCHTKKIVGYAMDDHYKTSLIETAISCASRNQRIAEGAIFHSDRGSNYTSADFGKKLKSHKIRQSVGRTGICYDNALAESFFGALKNERVNRTEYPTRGMHDAILPAISSSDTIRDGSIQD